MSAYSDRCEREDEEDRLAVLYRARAAWETAGRPGPDPQLPLIPFEHYRRAEVERAQLQDKPRKRR